MPETAFGNRSPEACAAVAPGTTPLTDPRDQAHRARDCGVGTER